MAFEECVVPTEVYSPSVDFGLKRVHILERVKVKPFFVFGNPSELVSAKS
jgi:hypothetical protein